jgi:hypothetical protein
MSGDTGIPVDEVVRVLETIEDVLLRGDDDARNLWDILSALRGPDVDPLFTIKGRTTVHVRRAAFPRLALKADMFRQSLGIPADFHAEYPFEEPRPFSHFNDHIVEARRALNRIQRTVG